MILVHDAGASRRPGFLDQRTSPVVRLIMMPLRAWTSGAVAPNEAAGVARSHASAVAIARTASLHERRRGCCCASIGGV